MRNENASTCPDIARARQINVHPAGSVPRAELAPGLNISRGRNPEPWGGAAFCRRDRSLSPPHARPANFAPVDPVVGYAHVTFIARSRSGRHRTFAALGVAFEEQGLAR